jgi:DNA-binding beta-propeller fold protein YncE
MRIFGMLVGLLACGTAWASTPEDCKPEGGFKFICGLHQPEDIVGVPGTQWIFASDLAHGKSHGDVYLVDRRTRTVQRLRIAEASPARPDASFGCASPPDPRKFNAHGLAVGRGRNGKMRLYVVNHGGRESVEIFEFARHGRVPRFSWIGCIVMPEGADANSVSALPDGGILVTSMFNIEDATFPAKLDRVARAEPSGAVWEWRAGAGFRRLAVPGISGANGVVVSPDGSYLVVSGWAENAIYRVDLSGRKAPVRIPVNFMPDNLRITEDGMVLVAGQAKNNVPEGFPCLVRADRPKYCAGSWGVVLLDPRSMTISREWSGDSGPHFGDVTTAIDMGDALWLSSLSGDRIAILKK